MGCSFSSPELGGSPGGVYLVPATYGFQTNGSDASDFFGAVGGIYNGFAGDPSMGVCTNPGDAQVYLNGPEESFQCNNVDYDTYPVTIACPVHKTDLSPGLWTISFSRTDDGNPFEAYVPATSFSVGTAAATTTVVDYKCVAEFPPRHCKKDSYQKTLAGHGQAASQFCTEFLQPTYTPAASCAPGPGYNQPDLHCGEQGTLSNPMLLGKARTFSCGTDAFENCQDSCLANRGCNAFSFDYATSECSLYAHSLVIMGFQPSASGPVFYSSKCFAGECNYYLPPYVESIKSLDPSALSSACYCYATPTIGPGPIYSVAPIGRRQEMAQDAANPVLGQMMKPVRPRGAVPVGGQPGPTPTPQPKGGFSGPDQTYEPVYITSHSRYTAEFCLPTVSVLLK